MVSVKISELPEDTALVDGSLLEVASSAGGTFTSKRTLLATLAGYVVGKLNAALDASPLTIGRGGTGAATASAARTNLGLGTLATQSGTFSGTSSGNNTGDQASVSGNAGTATKLATARTIAGSSFDGTANITIADTALTGAAWTSYTPTITAASGSFGSVSASGRYKQVGKTVTGAVFVTITSNGTASGFWSFTVPVTAATAMIQSAAGRETAVVGSMVSAQMNAGGTGMLVLRYDNTYIGNDGYKFAIQFTYEAN